MGNMSSNIYEPEKCLICWDQIDVTDLIECTRCNIHMHAYCEETFRGGKGYCKCPHCQRVGTLGISVPHRISKNI